jgi:AcrR family transcriptional regulator
VNGSIFYYFGSMDALLAETARVVAERGVERVQVGLGGARAHVAWPDRLSAVIRSEAEGEDGRAVMELLVGARTSPSLAAAMRTAIDAAVQYAAKEMMRVVGDTPVGQLLPVKLVAELAAAAFLGLELLTQNGVEIDLEAMAAMIAAGIQLLSGSAEAGSPPLPPGPHAAEPPS